MTDYSGGFGSRKERREAERRAQLGDSAQSDGSSQTGTEVPFQELIGSGLAASDGGRSPSNAVSSQYQPLDISSLSREELERISAQAVIDARPPQYLVDTRGTSGASAQGSTGADISGGRRSDQVGSPPFGFTQQENQSRPIASEPETSAEQDLNTLLGFRSPSSQSDLSGSSSFVSRRQLRAQQQSQTAEQPTVAPGPAAPQPFESDPPGSLGATSPSALVREPQTNSIVVASVPDALSVPLTLSESVIAYPTGSIEIPVNISNPATGEISVISDADESDTAHALDSKAAYVSTIAPVRATGVIKSSTKLGVVPVKVKRGQGQIYLVLATAIMMVTVGGLLAVAFILGVFE